MERKIVIPGQNTDTQENVADTKLDNTKETIDIDAIVEAKFNAKMAEEKARRDEEARVAEEERVAAEAAQARIDKVKNASAKDKQAEVDAILEDLRFQRNMTLENEKLVLVNEYGVDPARLVNIKDLAGLMDIKALVGDVRKKVSETAVNTDSVKSFLSKNVDIIQSLSLPDQTAKIAADKDIAEKTAAFKALVAGGLSARN